MLTLDNTQGFTQSQLDVMNQKAEALMDAEDFDVMDVRECGKALQRCEEKVLKEFGGA